ncbi:hypothetical protein GOBAR_AA14631 [Gossypium barbadense]|uniref:Transposase MuDR plant domain-containing protein n=1 Tax=Gossypium barbadense TaxID=3634 RepID=A0A2P5XRQ5_GOSBA|nr:hypothetical protein GOBAR_AA14631 [Gossypium barbadense]
MREVQDYRMKPEQDIVQHVITYFPEEDTGSEMEENVELNLNDPIKFTEMELVDDEDVETMIALYYGNGSDKNTPIHLFAELAGMDESTIRGIDIDLNVTPDIDVVGDNGYDSSDPCGQEVDSDSDPDVDDVPDVIDDEDVNNDGNINASSVENQMRRIVIHNNTMPHMSLIDPDAAHVAEFSERSGVPWRSIYYIRHIMTNFHLDYKNADWKRQVVKMAHELEPHIFRQRMTRLESDIESQMNISFRQWLGTMEPWQWTQSFDESFHYGQMTTNLVEEVNQMEAGHLFVEDVRDVMVTNRWMARSMNEVPSTTFEFIPDRGLRKNPRGHLQSTRIRNKMDITKKSDGTRCGLCRLAGHNRSKYQQRNYHVGQSSRSGRN